MAVILETVGLTRHFDHVVAADDISVRIRAGEWVGIVGANGAGKTTFLNLVTGYVKPDRGQIRYMGRDITGLAPRDVVRLGIARSFQIPQLYASMSVLENVMVALAARSGRGFDFWRPFRHREWLVEAQDILDRFALRGYAAESVTALPEGGRKLLDVVLSFALQPRLLLMDEPTSGVGTEEKFAVMDTLAAALEPTDVTVIFVEHDMDVVRRYAQRVLVFNRGRVVADGNSGDVP